MSSYQLINATPSAPPMVSVAMLAYNHQAYIAEAIESVLMQQTTFSVVLVIAEDASPDKTRDVILEYQKKYPERIKLILQGENVGTAKNNSSLFEHLDGKYIAALEGDDYWVNPLKLQMQIDFLEANKGYVACGASTDILRYGKLEITEPPYPEASFSPLEVRRGYGFPTLTAVFRNRDFAPFFQFQPVVGDIELFLYLSQFGDFKQLPFLGGVYRYHGKGAVSGKDPYTNKKMFIRAKINFNMAFKVFPKELFKEDLRNHINAELIRMGKDILKRRKGFRNSVDFIFFCLKLYRTF